MEPFYDNRGFVDRPFGCPLDITLDVPVPPSVNVARKIDHAGKREVGRWKLQADRHLMLNSQYRKARTALGGKPANKFMVVVTLDKAQTGIDLDNAIKVTLDYLKSRELIVDDGQNHCEGIDLRWGVAPAGCRIVLKPIAENWQTLGEVSRQVVKNLGAA